MSSKCWLAIIFVAIQLVGYVHSDFYTSISGLEVLLDSEDYFVGVYENYLKEVQATRKRILNFLNEVEPKIKDIKENPNSYFQDPLKAFKVIKRLVLDWKRMQDLILLDKNPENYYQNITKLTTLGYVNTTTEDLFGASKGLARLQSTYDLKTYDISDGILLGKQYESELSAHDCFDLGRTLYQAQKYHYSAEWLIQARMLLHSELEEFEESDEKVTPDFPYISDVAILEFLGPAMHESGNYKTALVFVNELLAQEPSNVYALRNKPIFESDVLNERRAQLESNYKGPARPLKSNVEELYEAVCRGSVRQTPAEQRKLRCRFASNNVPYRLIAPFKMEELSHDPFVAFYHEAILENEMIEIMNKTEDSIERSRVGDVAHSSVSDVRTSKNTWLYYHEHRFLDPIRQRLQDITGLSLDSAEPLQVANYGIGGHYGPHYDFSEDPNNTYDGKGNRILTALFYINDPELGGATAFPFLHLAVPAIKGSLVVWHNLHKSLQLDYRTKHAGCPVLKGSKWICNEWFHEIGQEFLRPCGLKPDGEKSLPYRGLV